MYAFLSNRKPKSVNARSKQTYKEGVRTDFESHCAGLPHLPGKLYAIVYYFHNVKTDLDADNMSKPIWDALESSAYSDDKVIRWRCAGTFDLRADSIEVLDLSGIPDSLFAGFLRMIDEEDHILYVEVGLLNHSLFKFGCEGESEV